MENDSWNILWNFTIQTDHVNQVTRPDMVIIVKIKNECKIILTLQAPLIAKLKRGRKITIIAYNSLKRELKKIWDMPLKVISTVVGAQVLTNRVRAYVTYLKSKILQIAVLDYFLTSMLTNTISQFPEFVKQL